ncbi:MAG TPA: adenosylcobalamin-dependent ribonucleoside-diphosphate reductase [Thermoproteota archaeon]|nr:adenosylcobalamin-dependent ribonucleoside-diphosphate reductase [Thermoproteota archaeon]
MSERKVIKRDGTVVGFNPSRIERAIRRAMLDEQQYDQTKLESVLSSVLKVIEGMHSSGKTPSVEEIQDIVEMELVKHDLFEVARSYIIYRKERERIREEKKGILKKEVLDEVDKDFSVNSLRLLAARYLQKDTEGNFIEGPKQMFKRIAALVVIPDMLHDVAVFSKAGDQQVREPETWKAADWDGKTGLKGSGGEYEFTWNKYHLERMKALYDELNEEGKMKRSWAELWDGVLKGEFDSHVHEFNEYYSIMATRRFLPNSPTLFNAGTLLGQLSACFVLSIEDDIESIMTAATDSAVIFKSGGGIGLNYSKLRPTGDIVFTTSGVASGPVSFMRIIDTVTDVVRQGGRRRGANMGILDIDHADIESFILCKSEVSKFENFNISVMVKEDFWDFLAKNEPYPLINPRNGKTAERIDPARLFETIAKQAWKNGDPGVVFFDNINKRNVMKSVLGPITTTNPCGEEPLYPYESCNLGSLNLHAFIKEDEEGGKSFEWDRLKESILVALRFLDNVIDVNRFPFPAIERSTKRTRKIGLGVMGLADILFALNLPYNSEAGFEFMEKAAEFLSYWAMWESAEISGRRGAFPLFSSSAYRNGELPIEGYYHKEDWKMGWEALVKKIGEDGVRNAECTTIAPTGSISMIADTSSGIEPAYALAYEKRVTVGNFYYTDEEFEKRLKLTETYSEKLLKDISDNGGSLEGIEEVPDDFRAVFQTALDIPWWDHLRAQAAFAKWMAAAVSKTINMPSWVGVPDVLKAYLFAHRLGIKGVTVYRDGSRPGQVLVSPSSKRGGYVVMVKNKTVDLMKKAGIEPEMAAQAQPANATAVTARASQPAVNENNDTPLSGENHDRCPSCGSTRISMEGGCGVCMDCGWSFCPVA